MPAWLGIERISELASFRLRFSAKPTVIGLAMKPSTFLNLAPAPDLDLTEEIKIKIRSRSKSGESDLQRLKPRAFLPRGAPYAKCKSMKSRVKAMAAGALIAALISVLLWQQRVIDDLRRENTALDETSKRPTRTRSAGTDDAIQEEIEIYRQRASEVHGLRNRVAQLSREKDDLQEEVERLRKKPNGEQLEKLTRDPQVQKTLRRTNDRLDVAIEGIGFFEVQLPNGRSGYTRDGSWNLDRNGLIMTRSGMRYHLGIPLSLPPGSKDIEILPNGETKFSGPDGPVTYRIQIFRFRNPAGLENLGLDLYEPSAASGPPEQGNPGENGFGTLAQGFLEASE